MVILKTAVFFIQDISDKTIKQFFILIYALDTCKYMYLYNNTPSNAIVNAASDITYRPVIEADDTGR
jgi:hypothetical protein